MSEKGRPLASIKVAEDHDDHAVIRIGPPESGEKVYELIEDDKGRAFHIPRADIEDLLGLMKPVSLEIMWEKIQDDGSVLIAFRKGKVRKDIH